MAKKAIEFTQVDQLTGRIAVSVSGGTMGKADYVPETDGFIIEVRYDNEAQKMGKALSSTRIDVQNILRVFYRANKRFPFAPGKVQKVGGTGTFELPVASHVDKLEAQAAQGLVSTADLIRIAKAAGMSIPAEWIAMVETLRAESAVTLAELNKPAVGASVNKGVQSDDNDEIEMQYARDWLDKQTTAKLQVLCQDEEIDHEELTAEEMRDELEQVEKHDE